MRGNRLFVYVGIMVGLASAVFALIHPTDFKILALLANITFAVMGFALFRRPSVTRDGDLQTTSADIAFTARLFFVVTVTLFNIVIRNELSRVAILSEPLKKIGALQGKTYEWRRDEFGRENFPEGRVTGVIAQEIEKVLPGLVGTRQDGYKGVAYQEIVPILIEAVKEQQKTIDKQRSDILAIKEALKAGK